MLRVDHLNVGHGDMSLVEFPDGKFMLVDVNIEKDSEALDVLRERIPEVGGKRVVDVLAVTHPDADHIRGIDLLEDEGFQIDAVWESGFRWPDSDDRPEYQTLLALIADLGGSKVLQARREPYSFGGSDVFCFCSNGSSSNGHVHYNGLVLKVEHAGRSVLFAGDCDLAAARDKVVKHYGPCEDGEKENLLTSDYLHASHHGSRSFFKVDKEAEAYTRCLELIDPDVTVVSCLSRSAAEDMGGEDQDWPPHDDAIQLYEQQSVEVLLTGEDGVVSYEFSDEGVVARAALGEDVQLRVGRKRGTKPRHVTVKVGAPAVVLGAKPQPWTRRI